MSEFSNTPFEVLPQPGSAGWFPVWIKAVTKPSEQTFVEITEHPDAQPKTAYIWIFLAGTISTLVSGFVQAAAMAQTMSEGGMESSPLASIVGVLCGAPVGGVFSVLFFALGVAITQWVAKLFGGTGTYENHCREGGQSLWLGAGGRLRAVARICDSLRLCLCCGWQPYVAWTCNWERFQHHQSEFAVRPIVRT